MFIQHVQVFGYCKMWHKVEYGTILSDNLRHFTWDTFAVETDVDTGFPQAQFNLIILFYLFV